MNTLSERQERFCIEYVRTLNAKQSYLTAYPSVKDNTAEVQGSKLLRNPKVKEKIEKMLNKDKSERIASANEVLELLTQVARGELTEDIVTSKGSVVYDMKPQVNSRLKALDLLAKRYGLLTEKIDVKGNIGVNIVSDIPNEEDDE